MQIKAIETDYNGIRFRSRREARWAVFFDAAGIPWEYEPEAYDLSAAPCPTCTSEGKLGADEGECEECHNTGTVSRGSYLPDFWLPKQKMFWEVKGELVNDNRLEALGAMTDTRVILAWGPIEPDHATNDDDWHHKVYPGWDHYYNWAQCSACGALDCTYSGRADYVGCSCPNGWDRPRYGASSVLERAFAAVRSHRFWDPR